MKEKGRWSYPFEETNLDAAYSKEADQYALEIAFYRSDWWERYVADSYFETMFESFQSFTSKAKKKEKKEISLEALAHLILGAARENKELEFFHFHAGYIKCRAKIENVFGAPALMIGFDGITCNTEMYMLDSSFISVIKASRIKSILSPLDAYLNKYCAYNEYVYVDVEYDG